MVDAKTWSACWLWANALKDKTDEMFRVYGPPKYSILFSVRLGVKIAVHNFIYIITVNIYLFKYV